MRTVAIIEGFSGGQLHTRQFRKDLLRAGFEVIKKRRQADIIIAHSAGIYAIPADAKAQLMMLIGPTYWPGRPLIKRTLKHTRTSARYHLKKFGWLYSIRKKLLELYYFFRRHKYLWLGVLNNNKLARIRRLVQDKKRTVIIVRNADDPYCSPEIQQRIKGPGVKYVELPGVHDDFVSNPKPYIDLLLKEL